MVQGMPPRAKRDRLPESIEFGKRVRQLREGKDWTLEQLGEAAGMNELQEKQSEEQLVLRV